MKESDEGDTGGWQVIIRRLSFCHHLTVSGHGGGVVGELWEHTGGGVGELWEDTGGVEGQKKS